MAQAIAARLANTVRTIQQRWGSQSLQPLSQMHSASQHVIPTGFPALDRVLGIGGIPYGRTTELLDRPSGGGLTLALTLIANAQAEGNQAAYLDLGQTFDPDYAVHRGVDLDHLLLVRPEHLSDALRITQDLVRSGGVGMLVFDALPAQPEPHCDMADLNTALSKLTHNTSVALVFLTRSDDPSTPPVGRVPTASIRLEVVRLAWLYDAHDIHGYQTRITTLKNRFAPLHMGIKLDITFDDGIDGDEW